MDDLPSLSLISAAAPIKENDMTLIRINKAKTKVADVATSAAATKPALQPSRPDASTNIAAAVPAELLTVIEAATFAKVCPHTIRRWIKGGKLKAFNSGQRIRIDKAEVIAFLCNNEYP